MDDERALRTARLMWRGPLAAVSQAGPKADVPPFFSPGQSPALLGFGV